MREREGVPEREKETMNTDQLIMENLDYAKKIAAKYLAYVPADRKEYLKDELISAGYLGLTEAAHNFKQGKGTKFSTYAYDYIRGKIIKEMISHLGRDALLIDEEEIKNIASKEAAVEETVTGAPDLSDIPPEEQVAIVGKKLKEFGLSEDEMRVFFAVNGIGREKVTNLTALGRELKKREFEIRRLKQSAEQKVRRSTS